MEGSPGHPSPPPAEPPVPLTSAHTAGFKTTEEPHIFTPFFPVSLAHDELPSEQASGKRASDHTVPLRSAKDARTLGKRLPRWGFVPSCSGHWDCFSEF